MPAERTADVAVKAQRSRDITLTRNAACLTCRARKVRCDALRPACTACRKTAKFRHEDPDVVICQYTEPEEDAVSVKPKGGPKRVTALEEKIEQLEALIRSNIPQQQLPPMPYPSYQPQQPAYPPAPTQLPYPSYPSLPQQQAPFPHPPVQPPYTNAYPPQTSSSSGSSPFAVSPLLPNTQNQSTSTATPSIDFNALLNTDERAGSRDIGDMSAIFGTSSSGFGPPLINDELPDGILSLLYPSWPTDLPNPGLLQSLCELFFSSKSVASIMVNRSKLLAALVLPPTHKGFPSVALLHAMCAVASNVTSHDDPLGLERLDYWRSEPTPTLYHLKWAKVHTDDAASRGGPLFQVAQAVVLVCFTSYSLARWVEVWLYCSLATRFCTPLGLNHLEGVCTTAISLRDANAEDKHTLSIKPALIPPPVDEAERYERAMTMYVAFCCDRFASSNTGWAHSITEDDITSLLPNEATSTSRAEPSVQMYDCLDIHSPAFLTSHPPAMVRSVQLMFKSLVLLGRINSYLQRAPWPIGAKTSAKTSLANTPDLRETAMFKRLDADTVAFRLSFPRDLRAALKRDVSEAADLDIYLLLAHQVAHVSTILLHESFCTVKVNDPSMARCSSSARAILVYLMSDSARAMSILNPFTSFCWSIAGRTMIREIAIHSHRGDTQAAAHGEAMVRHFLHRLSSVAQNKLTHTVVGMLTSLLSNNSSCLPRFGRQFTCAEDEERTNAELFDVDAPRSMHAYASGQPMMPMGAMGSSRRMTEQATMQAAYAAPPAATKSGEQRFATINTPSGSSQEAKTPSEGVEFTTSSMLLDIEEGRAGEMSEEEVHKLLETYVAASPGPSGGLFTPGATSWM